MTEQRDWLASAVGFAVASSHGQIGRLVDVERDADTGRPVALVVRTRVPRTRRALVTVDQVVGVLPGRRLILVDANGEGRVQTRAAA